jgi:YD repeat-containing protein
LKAQKGIVGALMALALLCLAFPPAVPAQNNTALQSFYDDLGQLTKVVDPSGNVTTYTYDAVGNILQISLSTVTPGTLAIFNFAPQRASIGATVAIQGQGFSPTPSADVVTFNGTPATVVSATATTLAATVPTGATTGPISVTVGGSTAQSSNFTVAVVLVSIAAAPANVSVPLGTRQQFTATGKFSDNSTQDLTASVIWASSNVNVATIFSSGSKAGLATSMGIGTTMITASFGSVQSAPVALTVTPAAVVLITVSPANFPSPANAEVPYKAMGTFSNNSVQDLTTSATWSSSNTSVATIGNGRGNHGLATTLANGTTLITATSGSVSGSSTLTVSPQAPPPPTFALGFALVPNGDDGSISVSALDAITGQLRARGYVNAGAAVISVDPSGQFAYTVGHGSSIVGYTIDPHTGSLTRLPDFFSPVFSWVMVDPTGRFLFATFSGRAEVWAYTIGPSGTLTAVPGAPFPAGHGPQSVTVDPLGKFAYVLNGNDGTLSAFAINPVSGVLTPITGSPFASGSNPSTAALDGSGRFLYAANAGSNNVSAYIVASATGALKPIGAPFAAGAGPVGVAAEPTGKFLYVANSASNNVTAYRIDAGTGALSRVAGSPFPVGTQPVSITIDPSGKFVYVMNSHDLTMFAIDAVSGALTARRTYGVRGRVSFPGNIEITRSNAPLTFTPKFAYVANNGDNNVSANSIDPVTGALKLVPGSPFSAGQSPLSVTSDPAGKFAYVANKAAGTISAYTIDSVTGIILQVPGSPFAAGSGPASVAVDSSGKFIYAANRDSNNVSGYSIGSTDGSLTPIRFSPFPANNGPTSATVEPLGKFAYVANQSSNDVSIFAINTSDGRLNSGAGPRAAGCAPVSVSVDPTGSFVYIANSLSNDVSAYSIVNRVNGDLSPILGSASAAGVNPSALTVDISGNYLYVANAGSNNVSAYSIDHGTGALTALVNSPFPAGTKPSSVAVDVSGKFLYVVNAGSNNVSVFLISPTTGSLTVEPNSPFPAGTRPMSIGTTGEVQ